MPSTNNTPDANNQLINKFHSYSASKPTYSLLFNSAERNNHRWQKMSHHRYSAENVLEIRLFGPPQITLNKQRIHFESRKAVALLAFLSLHEKPSPRIEIATLLWPESDRKRALGALRYTLSLLRKELGEEWLAIDQQQIGLAQDPTAVVDVLQFRTLLKECSRHQHASTLACAECLPLLSQAVDLFRGDLLSGFSLRDSANFEEWHFFQSETLRRDLAGILQRLARYHAAHAAYQPALDYANRWLQLDPLQEEVQRELIRIYAAAGQRTSALRQYEACARLLAQELGVEPSAETQALYREILQGESTADILSAPMQSAIQQRAHTSRLPAPATPLIGRETEVAEVITLLSGGECRLLTLFGPGGIGKTRLALHVAHQLAEPNEPVLYPDGIFFAALAAVHSEAELITALADVLGLRFSGTNAPKQQLFNFLQQRQLLLLLDNFEQLVPAAGSVDDLLTHAPKLNLLITSRQRLDLPAEWLYEVTGLASPTPEQMGDAASFAAIALFDQRARRINPRFRLQNQQNDVAHISQLVEGMPLAIELAAGWVRAFSCREIAQQIKQNLDFLAQDSRGVTDRHRSLRATFLHSWGQLDEEERAVFARLAIFRGGVSLAAAQSVAGASHLVLARLVDKSMLRHSYDPALGQDRYSIHELLRQFGVEQLLPNVMIATERRHCSYFAEWLCSFEESMRTEQEADALRVIAIEIGDLRAAWLWLATEVEQKRGGSFAITQIERMSPMLAHFFFFTSRYDEGERLFSRMVEALKRAAGREGSEAEHHRLLAVYLQTIVAEFYVYHSRFSAAIELIDAALPLLRQHEASLRLGGAFVTKGRALIRLGKYAAAQKALEEAVAAYEEAGDPLKSTDALNAMGVLFSNQGRFDEAERYYRACLELFRTSGYARGISNLLSNLGSNFARNGFPEEARPLYEEAYQIARQGNDRLVTGVVLSNLGSIARTLGDLSAARIYYDQSLLLFREMREQRWTAASLNGLGLVLIEMGSFDAARACILEAVKIAHQIESVSDMLDALAVLGEIILETGETEQAINMLRVVATHPVTQTLARARSRELLSRQGLPLPQMADAKSAKRSLDSLVETAIGYSYASTISSEHS